MYSFRSSVHAAVGVLVEAFTSFAASMSKLIVTVGSNTNATCAEGAAAEEDATEAGATDADSRPELAMTASSFPAFAGARKCDAAISDIVTDSPRR
jgi:hypothetical protein